MKNFFSSIRMRLVPVSCVVLVIVLLAACSKFDNDDNNNNSSAAGLMSFNLAPDQSAVGVALSGSNLTNAPLGYTNYSGTYQPIYPGNRAVESYNYNSDSSIATLNYNFETNKYYSLFVAGANGVYTNIVTRDNFDSLSSGSGKTYVRYINAIPDSTKPTVSITANGNDVINAPAGFSVVSDFVAADPGQVTITVKNGSTIDANRTISLEQGKVYTVLLTGLPEATDTTKAVQIKYILNGSLATGQ
ncbi:MAG TPA: DUF4397 domain-containing protein [Chitinophagaceae bacterium]|nr:DUF4397 domain-containing protein [Chitinophagaceae bacterium]